MLLTGIDEQEFKEKVEIRFNNISDGFDTYVNGSLEGAEEPSEKNEQSFIEFFHKVFDLNGEDNSYIDFYYSRLSKEDKGCLYDLLIEEDKEILKTLKADSLGEHIYFKLTRDMIPFFTRLCTREALFSTFYFTKIPCTIWGNYNMKFPCFCKNQQDMNYYKEVSKSAGLKIL